MSGLPETEVGSSSPAQISPITWRQLVLAPLLGLVAGAVLAFLLQAVWLAALGHLAAVASTLRPNFFVNMATIAVLYVPAIWLMWRSAKRLSPGPVARFFPQLPARTVLVALATGVVAALACIAFEEVITRAFPIDFRLSPTERSFYPTTPGQLLAAFVVMAFVGPFAEEFYFRGFLLQWLRQRVRVAPAVVLSAVAFAVVHLFMLLHPGASGWVTTGEIFVVGLLMGLWVARTGSVWSSYALHIGYNAVVVVQTFLTQS